MTFTAAQIAAMIGGTVIGDAHASVTSFAKIEEAKNGNISFLANPKYEPFLYTTNASVVIINDSLQLQQPVQSTLIKVKDAYAAFAQLMAQYQKMQAQQLVGVESPVYIASTASYGNNCYIAAFSYLGNNVKIGDNVKLYAGVVLGNNVTIGDNTVLHAGVKIYHDCVIGHNVIVHAGVVIGSDGFGFAPTANGSYNKVPQLGNVIIENDVEIGANTTIDRATMGSTIVKAGTKLDNLVQIAHNVEVGCHTVIASQAGISGSTKVGNHVVIGGQTGVAGHITIANGTKVGGQSGITKSVKKENQSLNGTPAFDYNTQLKSAAIFKNLPALEKRIAELEAQLKKITH